MTEETRERNEEVLEAFVQLGNKAEVGRLFGISRARVGQIILSISGENNPFVKNSLDINWENLHKLRKAMGIPIAEVARHASINPSTANRILLHDPRYVLNFRHNKYHASVRVANAVMRLTAQRLKKAEKLVNQIYDDICMK